MADFTFFDQFMDMEVDLTNYLKSIEPTGSKYTLSNKQPVITQIKNLFTKYDIVFSYKNNINLILNYKVKDDEFIETVTNNIFGSPEYWWIIALFNDIKEPFKDWPLTQAQVTSLAKKLYEQEKKYNYETYFNFVTESNESRRDIIIPKKSVVSDIIWEYRQAIMASQ